MKQNATILVCCHKPSSYYRDNNFLPIQVGRAVAKTVLDMQGDDVGDNISEKNPYYCELTALYWYWKNGAQSKFIGLCHYRRYFVFRSHTFSLPNLEKLFNKYDIVLSKKSIYPLSLTDFYRLTHITEDLDILECVVKELYPEYCNAYYRIMGGNRMSPYNMFITTQAIFSDYMKWLFDILFEVEKRVSISKYPYQARVFGFMAERLLNVYVYRNNLRIKYVSVKQTEGHQNNYKFYEILKVIVDQIIFNLFKLKKNCIRFYKRRQ